MIIHIKQIAIVLYLIIQSTFRISKISANALLSLCCYERIQSRAQIKTSTVSDFKQLLYWSITFLPVLNADSEATVQIEIVKMSRAILKITDILLN